MERVKMYVMNAANNVRDIHSHIILFIIFNNLFKNLIFNTFKKCKRV